MRPTPYAAHAALPLCLVTALAACGGGGNGGSVDPSRVRASDLEGYWVARGTNGSPDTILGFSSAARARFVLPFADYDLVPPSEPVSVVYRADGTSYPDDVQYATYDVSRGSILQTVLGDIGSLPGTMYLTEIFDFVRDTSMTLESSNDPSGDRTYTFYDRCPVQNTAGWQRYRGAKTGCLPANPLGNSLTFDESGDVHALHGVGSVIDCEEPTYAYITEACLPRTITLPNFRWSDVDATGGVVRLALSGYDERLVVRSRRLDELDFGPEIVVDALPGTARRVRFLDGASRPTILWSGTTTGLDVVYHEYRLETDGVTWTKRSNAEVPYPYDAVVAPSGEIVFAENDALHRTTETGVSVGTPIALPNTRLGIVSPLHLTPDGRVQFVFENRVLGFNVGGVGGNVIGNEAVLAEWNGSAWTTTVLGNSYGAWIVSQGDGPTRVLVAARKASIPDFVMHTVMDGAIVASEHVDAENAFAPGASPSSVATPSAVVGPNGEIATSFDGTVVHMRRGTTLTRAPATVSLAFSGLGAVHVTSDDGRIDCTSACTITASIGERIRVTLDAPLGWNAVIDCEEMRTYGGSSCFLDVREPTQTYTITSERTAVQRTLVTGNASLSSAASLFDARGANVVLQVEFVSGARDVTVGTAALELPTFAARAVVGYDRNTGAAFITPIPVAPLALAAASDGGAWLAAAIDGTASFGSVTLGVNGDRSLVRVRYDASGAATTGEVLSSGPSATFAVSVADVDPDGTTVAITRTGSTTSFVRAAPAQLATATPIATTELASEFALDGARALVRFTTLLVATNGAAIAGTRSFTGGGVGDIALFGTRAVALVSAPSGSLDLGGGVEFGYLFIAQFDGTLGLVASELPPAAGSGTTRAIATVTDATFLAIGDLVWRYDTSLAQTTDPIAYPHAQPLAQGQDEDSLVLLQTGRLVELRPE